MAVPTIEAIIDWRKAGLNTISNEGFETNTTGWSVGAGINAAGTSITRTTGDSYLGAACAELVTTGTNGSGCNFDFGTTTFTSGRTYRFSVWLKRISGAATGKILIGSLGTGGDRASSTPSLTTSWAKYSVDWTPNGNRTDVEVNITNGSAAILTVRLDAAEVRELNNDVSAYFQKLTIVRGSNWEGRDEASALITVTLKNSDQRFDPDNGASPLTGLVKVGRTVWIRAEYAGLTYGLAHGIIRRIVLLPLERAAQFTFEDQFGELARDEANRPAHQGLSIQAARALVLSDASVPSASQSLSGDGPEADIPITGWSDQTAASVLSDLNEATGSVHWVAAGAQTSAPYVYTTKARTQLAGGSSAETFSGTETGVMVDGYDFTDEALTNKQRVLPFTPTIEPEARVWTANHLPFNLAAGETREVWASLTDPVLGATAISTYTGAGSITFTPYYQSGLFTCTGPVNVTDLGITGKALVDDARASVVEKDQTSINTYGERVAELSTDFVTSDPIAHGLAAWYVYRFKDGPPRPVLKVANRFPSQCQREIGDRITLTATRLSISGKEFHIRGLTHSITPMLWETAYSLEQAPATDTWFQLDTAARGLDDAAGGAEGKLAY